MRKDRTVIGLNLPAFLMMIGVGMIVALFPQRIIDFDGDGRRVGYVASMFALSYIAFQVPVGALADRFGLPIHAIGVGEQIDDLAPFDPEEFARALVGAEA